MNLDRIPSNTTSSNQSVNFSSKKSLQQLSARLASASEKINNCVNDSSTQYIQVANEARELKKLTKDVIKSYDQNDKSIIGKINRLFRISNPEEIKKIKAQYNEFSTTYDRLVSQKTALIQARNVSQIIRNNRKQLLSGSGKGQNKETCDFTKLCRDFKIFDKDLKLLSAPKDTSTSKNWEVFRARLINAQHQLNASQALMDRKITWLHGTRSPAMQVMLAKDRTLYPTGQLLEHNIIPLTGELGKGIVPGLGANATNISGTSLSRVGVKTTIQYAEDFKAQASNEWKSLTFEQLKSEIDFAIKIMKNDPKLEGSWSGEAKFGFLKAAIYIGRLKVIDPKFNLNVKELRANLTRLIAECPPEHKEQIASLMAPLLRECDTPPFINPTREIQEGILNSFPIVLGSTNVEGKAAYDKLDEHLVGGSVSLQNIHVAFTTSENVEKLREMIAKAGLKIEVMDFDALKLLGVNAPKRGVGFSA